MPLNTCYACAQTNYGGAQDGMSPYQPSFGTLEVRCCASLRPDIILEWLGGHGSDCRVFGQQMLRRRAWIFWLYLVSPLYHLWYASKSKELVRLHQKWLAGGLWVWEAGQVAVPLLERGRAVVDQLFLGGGARTRVRHVL